MPVFSLAATWSAPAVPARMVEVVQGLSGLFAAPQPPPLQVSLGEEEAALEVRLEMASYPRAAILQLARQVEASGGRLTELWRLPRAERDTHRARLARGRVQTFSDPALAARALAAHLEALGAQPARRAPSVISLPPPPETGEPPVRRSPRYATRLEVVFHTEFDFVLEHATNISNGGLFVRTALRPELDTAVELEVRLPTGETLRGHGVVRHHRDDAEGGGVGLEFLHEDAAFSAALDRYLASLAGTVGG